MDEVSIVACQKMECLLELKKCSKRTLLETNLMKKLKEVLEIEQNYLSN